MIRNGRSFYGKIRNGQYYITAFYSFFFYCLFDSFEKYTNSEGKTMYATVGYTTIYLYYAYPANIRPRISQMLVLPPYQKLGIGTKFIEVSNNNPIRE